MMYFVKTKLALTISMLLVAMLFSAAVRADICVIRTDDYPGDYEGVKVCDVADSADGTQDGIINLEFYAGRDIEVDVVYQQEDTKYRMELYNMLMYYDTINMTNPEASDPNDPVDYITCRVDPSDYFKNNMSPQIAKAVCDYDSFGYAVDTDGTKVIAEYEMNFTGDNFPSAGNEPDTFVMDEITFTNESYVSGDTYEYFYFATTGGAPTDMGVIFPDNSRCPLINLGLQCGDNGITTKQTLLKTKVSISAPPMFVGTPTVTTPTCKGRTGCTNTSGEADYSFSYTVPTTCYADSSCSTTSSDCSNMSVVISDGTNTYEESDGTFTATANVGDVIDYYTVWGAADGGDSTSLNCSGSETGTVSVSSVTCKCGAGPPPVNLVDSGKYGDDGTGTWYVNRDIEIDFQINYSAEELEEDDIDLQELITDIKLYFSDDGGETTHYYDVQANTKTAMDALGAFSGIIDGEYISECGTDIFFGVIATTEDGITGAYPYYFSCTSDTECDWSDSSTYEVVPLSNSDNCIEETSLKFVEEPFPNQLPFRAGPGELLKVYFNFSGEADVTMRIYSMDGHLVRQIGSDRDTQISSSMERSDCTGEGCNFCNYATGCAWDGTNSGGAENYVSNGMYIVNIHASGDGIMAGQEYDYTKAVVVMK